jgi:hypothetical protein
LGSSGFVITVERNAWSATAVFFQHVSLCCGSAHRWQHNPGCALLAVAVRTSTHHHRRSSVSVSPRTWPWPLV